MVDDPELDAAGFPQPRRHGVVPGAEQRQGQTGAKTSFGVFDLDGKSTHDVDAEGRRADALLNLTPRVKKEEGLRNLRQIFLCTSCLNHLSSARFFLVFFIFVIFFIYFLSLADFPPGTMG